MVWADILRAILIILVVLGHALQFGDYENRLSWNIIYSFHMAAFFAISGFVSYRPNSQGVVLWKRAKQLLIPFFVWTVLIGLLQGNTWEHCLNVLYSPDKSFWFLFVLFAIVVLHEAAIALSRKIGSRYLLIFSGGGYLALILLMVLFEVRIFGFQFISYYFGFYALGYALRYYNIVIKPSFALCCGCLWFVLSLYWRMHAVPEPLEWMTILPAQIINYSYRFVTALCACIFLIGISPVLFKNREAKLFRFLAYLGRISLGIYVLHIFIGRWVDPLLVSFCGSMESILSICIEVLVKLAVSILGVELIRRIPMLSKLLLGK